MKIELLFPWNSPIMRKERKVIGMRSNQAKQIALGGVLAALAMVVMFLGGMIPVATFVCPAMCMLILQLILRLCPKNIAWAWYAAVAILSTLMGPDKEAAAIFVCLGYYPIIKQKMDLLPLHWLWKGIYFNAMILLVYGLLIRLLGMDRIAEEYRDLGTMFTVILLLSGNLCFFLLDRALTMFGRRRRRRG